MTTPTFPAMGNPVAFAEYCASILVRMIKQTGAVADDAVQKMDAGDYGCDNWFKSVNQLADVAMQGGMELAETIFAGPGFKLAQCLRYSDWYPVGDGDECQYQVTICTPLSRGVSADPIPDGRISYQSKQGEVVQQSLGDLLPVGAEHFRLVIDRTDLQSGYYWGEARITRIPATSGAAAPNEHIVPVTIKL